MSSQGKSLLLWCSDSDFDVDDEATSTFQVPFLTWDLHAMASQLQKLSLPQRLLIDKKHLEEGLFDGIAEIMSGNSSGLREIQSPSVFSKDVKASQSPVNYGNVAQDVIGHLVAMEEASTGNSQAPLVGGAKRSVPRASQDGVDMDSGGSMQSVHPQSQSGLLLKASSLHEARSAEAELDKLLDSLDELPGLPTAGKSGFGLVQPGRSSLVAADPGQSNSAIGSSSAASLSGSGCSSSSSSKAHELENQSCLSSRHTAAALFLDDTIDDLLAQTAGTPNVEQGSAAPYLKEGKGMEATSISQALDDLDLLLDGF